MQFEMASAEVKMELEEVQLSTSGGDEQGVSEQVLGQQVTGEQVEGEESYDSDQFDDEFLTKYCEMVDIPHPMTISKELFYTMRWWLEIIIISPSRTKIGSIK